MQNAKIVFNAVCEGLGLVVIISFVLIMIFGGEFHIKINFYTALDLFKKLFK